MTAASKKISVLVVDDHPMIREGLASMLNAQSDMQVVAEAARGEEALVQFRLHRPDIVLMDLRLPKMSGVQAISAIRAEAPEARIIVLTTYSGDEDVYRALHAGARAYLLKEESGETLLDAIRTVYAGRVYIPGNVAERLAERMPKSDLTVREMTILKAIMRGLTNREIAKEHGITEETVKFHITNILGKLGVGDRTQAVVTALQRGILHLE